jgi:hypothetical protein
MERLSLRDGRGAGGGGGAATATAPLAVPPCSAAAAAASSAPLAVGAGCGGARPTQPIALLPPAAVRHVREAFGELLATSPSSLILSLGQGSVSRSAGGGGPGGASLAQAAAAEDEQQQRGGARGGSNNFNPVQYEAAMWDAFAQVYSAEVEARIQQQQQQQQQRDTTAVPTNPAAPATPLPVAASGAAPRDAQLSVEDRRQVLADILVWAEVTRPGYDAAAADFVTGPHASDAAFKRVGEALKRAKEERGLA